MRQHRAPRLKRYAALVFMLAATVASHAHAGPEHGWQRYTRPAPYGVILERDVSITMRDGVVLAADVYRPDADGTFPVIVTMTPYNKAVPLAAGPDLIFVQYGYVQVLVDVRGTGGSGGTFEAFGEAEQRDGYEVVEWAARQPWSTGAIGMWGQSYHGINQLLTAAQRPPSLRAIFPSMAMSDAYRDTVMVGGGYKAGLLPGWHSLISALNTAPPTYAANDPARATLTWLQHLGGQWAGTQQTLTGSITTDGELAYDGPFYRLRSPIEAVDLIDVPTFLLGGHHDYYQRGMPLLYERLRARGVPVRLLMGDWAHAETGQGLAEAGLPDIVLIALQWFDHFLLGIGPGIEAIPNVVQAVIGTDSFAEQADWPHPGLEPQRLYLAPGGALAPAPSSATGANTIAQAPAGGGSWRSTCAQTLIGGLIGDDQCPADHRAHGITQLVFASEPLDEPRSLSGPVAAHLSVATTARDALMSVRLLDVAPDGSMTELTAGWLVASMRALDMSKSRIIDGELIQPYHRFTKDSVYPLDSGERVELDIEIWPVSAQIAPGHRIALAVGAGDAPHVVSPAPRLADEVGALSVFHGGVESFVVLPVVASPLTFMR